MRKRAGGLYIKNKSLLLICESHKEHYWTPGGGLDDGEDFEQALARELREELVADLISATHFFTLYDTDADEEIRYFLIDADVPDDPPNGTVICWYRRENYAENNPLISSRIYNHVFPKLLEADLV